MITLACHRTFVRRAGFLLLVLFTVGPRVAKSADCPQFGGSPSRNNVAQAEHLPVEWGIGQFDESSGKWLRKDSKNVRWVARLGSQTYATPVVADGRVFVGTNNAAAYLARYPAKVDLGCLLAFGENDGHFDWQLSCPKLAGGREIDFPETGICCSPLVEGTRLWLVTSRCEVVCMETAGTADHEAKVVWTFDMIGRLGVTPHNMTCSSLTAAGDYLLVGTSNGVDDSHKKTPSPRAPSFIALEKKTGRLAWSDSSPGENILHGQWSSPAFGVIGGVPQAIFAGGDGWVYGFRFDPAMTGKPELLWKFDCNAKTSLWKEMGDGDRNSLVATPVIYGDRIYVATGDDPEFGEGPGCLWCIDATRRGDVSPEIVVDRRGKSAPPRRLRAADAAAGDVVKPNPNSAAVWRYVGPPAKPGEKPDTKAAMHRTLGMAAIKDDVLVIADLIGLVHCLDARTGRVYWTHDLLAAVWGTPLIADGKIYLGNEDGDVAVFECSPTFKLLAKNAVGAAVYTSPVAVGDTLYVATRSRLLALAAEKP